MGFFVLESIFLHRMQNESHPMQEDLQSMQNLRSAPQKDLQRMQNVWSKVYVWRSKPAIPGLLSGCVKKVPRARISARIDV